MEAKSLVRVKIAVVVVVSHSCLSIAVKLHLNLLPTNRKYLPFLQYCTFTRFWNDLLLFGLIMIVTWLKKYSFTCFLSLWLLIRIASASKNRFTQCTVKVWSGNCCRRAKAKKTLSKNKSRRLLLKCQFTRISIVWSQEWYQNRLYVQ